MSVQVFAFDSFGYLPGRGIAGSYGDSPVFRSDCTVFIPYNSPQGFQSLHILASTCCFLGAFV